MKFTKDQAIEILNATFRSGDYCRTGMTLTEALASADAFTDGAAKPVLVPRCQRRIGVRQCAREAGHDLDCSLTPVSPVVFVPSAESVHVKEPSRPVATGSKALAEDIAEDLADALISALDHMSDATTEAKRLAVLGALDTAGLFDEPPTVATCSKARAEEILNEALPYHRLNATKAKAIGALDRAKFFADPATLAEIAGIASAILAADRRGDKVSGSIGIRLATACRKLGIGGDQ
jgi:hypothetical protein